MALKLLKKTVTGVNTATALITTNAPCSFFIIQAGRSNLDALYFGDSTVSSSSDLGIILSVTTGAAYTSTQQVGGGVGHNGINLNKVFISSSAAGAYVNVYYQEE